MMWLWHFSRSELLWNADVLATPGCIHKSAVPIQWERGHDTAYKMAMTLGMKRKTMDCEFPIVCICHVTSICHIKSMGDQRVVQGLPHECVMTYWDHGERVFHLSVLPLVFSILGMRHKASTLKWVQSLGDRKAVAWELWLLPFFSSRIVTSLTIFKGNNMPMCLVAKTHSS